LKGPGRGEEVQKRRLISVGTALILLGAACGGDGGGGGGGDGDDLVVGALVTLTGEFGSWGEDHLTNFEMAAEDVNAAGLLPGGSELKLVVEDESGTAEGAVRAAQKMVEVNGVQAIVGPSSTSMVALEPVAVRNQIPIISPAAGTVRLDTVGGEWLFRTYPSDSAEGAAVATYALDQGFDTMSILALNEESPQGIVKVVEQRFEEAGGDIAVRVDFDSGQPSYQAQVNEAVSANPAMLYLAGGEESGTTIIREIRQTGYTGPMGVNGDLTSPGFLKDVGPELMEGACGGQATPDESTPVFDEYAQEYKQVANEETYVTMPNAYDALTVIALAAVAGGDTSGETIQANLRDVAGPPGVEVTTFEEGAKALADGEDIDYTGPSGVVDFDETGTSPLPFSIYCVQSGKWRKAVTYQPEELQS
jgi:ABC-type branched-subunit amino acid transport system substrate-binding protein